MLNDRRSPTLSNAHPRAGLANADPVRNGQHEWAAQSAPLVLIASSVSSVRRAWREGAQAFAAVEVADHGQLLCCLTPRPPAILLLDLDLPQLGGMEGVSGLRALQPATRIIVLAGHPDEKEGLVALKIGAQGYCDRAIAPAPARQGPGGGPQRRGLGRTEADLPPARRAERPHRGAGGAREPWRPRPPARGPHPAGARDRRRAERRSEQQGDRPEVRRDRAHGQGSPDRGVPQAGDFRATPGRPVHARAVPIRPSLLTR